MSETESKVIFKAKTVDGYTVKLLIETLQYYLKKGGCFTFNENGIFMSTMDPNKRVLPVLELLKENFSSYHCKRSISFNTNLIHMHKMLKQVKKKDGLIITLEGNEMVMKVISGNNKQSYSASKITIQEIQLLGVVIPTGYTQMINIPSSSFQKTCRGMNNINKEVMEISCPKPNTIKFLCDGDGIMSREGVFGPPEDSDDELDLSDEEKFVPYKQTFNTQYITRLTKLAALSDSVKVFIKNDLPIQFKMNVGSLGTICVFVKSREQIAEAESDEEDEV